MTQSVFRIVSSFVLLFAISSQAQSSSSAVQSSTYDIHDAISIQISDRNLPITVLFADENLMLQIPHKCSGTTQSRGIGVTVQRTTARNFIDLSSNSGGLRVIWGYFKTSLECSHFISQLISATPNHHVILSIVENKDQTQAITLTINEKTYSYMVAREWYLNPF